MSDKKYYWLKLQNDFFSSKRIKKLRKLGSDFVIIYLKMQLLSLQNNGLLEYSGIEDSFAEEIALDIDEDTDKVQLTISYLQSCGLLEVTDENEFFLPYVDKCTGSASDEEKRKQWRIRQQRHREKLLLERDVTEMSHKSHVTLSLEKEIEKEKDKDKEIDKYIVEIVDYLNLVCHTNYSYKTKNTIKHINARLNEGFTVDDFKMVIDKKANEWLDTSMEQYLRPDTLFGTKFESYLNQNIVKGNKSTKTEEQAKEDWLKKWENA